VVKLPRLEKPAGPPAHALLQVTNRQAPLQATEVVVETRSPLVGQFIADATSSALPAQASASSVSTRRAPARGVSRPFDLERLLEHLTGDPRYCAMMLRKFAAKSDDLLAALTRAATAGRLAALAEHAYSLMGVAANMQAEDLRSCAADLYRVAHAGQRDLAVVALSRVKARLRRCQRAVPSALVDMACRMRAIEDAR
jgi:hypothetical protein